MADAPKQVGKYQIVRELGRGGFGVVYLTHDTTLDNRPVALKILYPQLVVDPDTMILFQKEASMTAHLDHPHIVTVYEAGDIGGVRFIAMRYVPGRTLAEVIKEEGPQPLDKVAKWLEQIASAIDYAHSQGLLHRDLKPGNIMLDRDGRAVVADFGLAKAVGASGGSVSSQDRQIMSGTARYTAPEQAKGKPVVQSDIYSLGVILYELLTGQVPFNADDPFAIAILHMTEEPRSPRELRPDLPETVEMVILRALAKQPAERFVSAGELSSAFQMAVQAGEHAPKAPAVPPVPVSSPGMEPHAPQPSPSAPKPEGSGRPRWLWPVVGAAAALLFLLVVAVLILGGGEQEGDSSASRDLTETAAVVAQEPEAPGTTEAAEAEPMPSPTPIAEIPTNTALPTPTATEPATETPTPIPSQTPRPSPTATVVELAIPVDTAWQGEYFDNNEFRSPAAYEREDAIINFDWGQANPAPGVDKDNFSVRWTRCYDFDERYYDFTGDADDRIEVWLDDTQILSAQTGGAAQKYYVPGGNHCLVIKFIEYGGDAYVHFDMEEAEKPTPVANAGWQGEYFANNEHRAPASYERQDAHISFDWEHTNPAPGVDKDNFSVRWTRCLDFEERYYLFRGKADDNLRVWLDDTQILDVRNEYTQKMYVPAGEHCLELKYREDGGTASVFFDFEPAEQPTPVSGGDTWLGEYFDNNGFEGSPAYTRRDAWIDFDWETANPVPGVGFDNFTVRWTRCMLLEDRTYAFHAKADDHIVVLMDGNEIINTSSRQKTQELAVGAGEHCFELRYREDGVKAWVYFWWE